MTTVIIAANIAAFFVWQPQATDAEAERFAYENAVIACEITTREPLSLDEIQTGRCFEGGPPVFANKSVWLAALVSMFLHGSLFHLLGNMWFLWIFGNNVEEAFGPLGYLAVYLVTGFAATVAFVTANPDSTVPLVGASGAIAGALGSYLVLYPTHRILTWFLFFFVPIPAIVFLGAWLLSQFAVEAPGVAWEAHVAGFLAGVALTLPLRSALLRRVARLHRPQSIHYRV